MFGIYPGRMANTTERGPTESRRFSVYVLRDPRDGVVFFVGRLIATGSGRLITDDETKPREPTVRARERAIRDEGHEVERLIVAPDLADEATATAVELAVIASYEAAQLGLVGASHRGGRGSSPGPISGGDPFDDPNVRQFVGQAATEIDRLSSALSSAEQELAAAVSVGFLDAGHRGRLESLILQQESEMARMTGALDRVRALRDLAEWAVPAQNSDGNDLVIRISDLSRALD